MRGTARRVVLSAAVAVSALTGVTDSVEAALPAPSQLRGIDVGAWGVLPEAESHRDLREAAALGANAVRVVLRWDWLAPDRRGAFNPRAIAATDRLLKTARREDLAVMTTVLFTPCWATSAVRVLGSCDPSYAAYPPQKASDFGEFISFVSDRWGSRLAGIEVWNEPNQPLFWRGGAGSYVSLVHTAAQAVRRSQARPRPPMVAGAISGSDTDYLARLYDVGIARWSDAISIHPYDLRLDVGFGDPSRRRPDVATSFASGIPAIRRTMRMHGDKDPLWLTEFGFADCPTLPYCVPSLTQGRYLSTSLRAAAQRKFIGAALVYRLRDFFGSGPLFEQRFGLLNRDWSAKPGVAEVRSTFAALRRGDRR